MKPDIFLLEGLAHNGALMMAKLSRRARDLDHATPRVCIARKPDGAGEASNLHPKVGLGASLRYGQAHEFRTPPEDGPQDWQHVRQNVDERGILASYSLALPWRISIFGSVQSKRAHCAGACATTSNANRSNGDDYGIRAISVVEFRPFTRDPDPIAPVAEAPLRHPGCIAH